MAEEAETTLDQSAPETPASEEMVSVGALELEGVEPEGSDADEGTEDEDDLEFGMKKYRVKKDLKEAVQKWQAATTQKEQALAEERKALAAIRTQHTQEAEEITAQRSDLRHAEKTIQRYKEIDWAALRQEDPDLAQQRFMELQEWKDHRDELKNGLAEVSERHALEAKRTAANRAKEAFDALTRDIPDWPKVARKVGEFAIKELGYTPQELDQMTDPRLGKALHRAMISHLASQQTATTKTPEPEIKPLTTVASRGGGGSRKSLDEMSMEEYAAARKAGRTA
jgi:hypothetical protein